MIRKGPSFDQYLDLLDCAYQSGGIKEVKKLIDFIPDVFYWPDSKKSSALISLIWACDHGYVDLVKALLSLPQIHNATLGALAYFLVVKDRYMHVVTLFLIIGEITTKNSNNIIRFASCVYEHKCPLKALQESVDPTADNHAALVETLNNANQFVLAILKHPTYLKLAREDLYTFIHNVPEIGYALCNNENLRKNFVDVVFQNQPYVELNIILAYKFDCPVYTPYANMTLCDQSSVYETEDMKCLSTALNRCNLF